MSCGSKTRQKYIDYASKADDAALLRYMEKPGFKDTKKYCDVEWKWYRREIRLEAQRRGLRLGT